MGSRSNPAQAGTACCSSTRNRAGRRTYLVNVLEYDLVNSFHVHGNVFDRYPTGTSLRPVERTDRVMLCQGRRGILEPRFGHRGRFMFHAHQPEFTELGWMGFFEVGCASSTWEELRP